MCTVTAALNSLVGFGLWTLCTLSPCHIKSDFLELHFWQTHASGDLDGKQLLSIGTWAAVSMEGTAASQIPDIVSKSKLTLSKLWEIPKISQCFIFPSKAPSITILHFGRAVWSGLGRAAPGTAPTSAREDPLARQRISTLAGLRKHLETFLEKGSFSLLYSNSHSLMSLNWQRFNCFIWLRILQSWRSL